MGEVVRVNITEAEIIPFSNKEDEGKSSDDLPKLKKDGTIKRTPNNNKEERRVDPIKDRETVARVSKYLLDKAKMAKRHDTMVAGYRNWLTFVVGINVGLRVSDLVNLKWSHFFEEDMITFVGGRNKKEQKTGKMKDICPNSCIKRAIIEYLDVVYIKPKYKDYVFVSSRTGKQITDATVESFIKDFSKHLNLKGNYGTHTLRKTYAYLKYMSYIEHGDPLALVKVQKDLNHVNSSQTADYLGITREEKIKSSMELGDYLSEAIAF